MKNAYSLFLRVPLFTFQPPEGPFLLLSGRHRRSSCLTGPREAGSGRRNQWGALGGVGMLLSSPQLLASASLLSNAIPVRPTLSHTNTHSHTRGGILASIKGPHGREKRALSHWRHWGWLAFLSGGMYCMYAHTLSHTHASSNTHRLVLSLLKIQTDTTNICTHMDTCRKIHSLCSNTHTHTTHRPCSVSVMPPSCSLGLYQEVSYNKTENAEILLQRGEGGECNSLRKLLTSETLQFTHTWPGQESVRKPFYALFITSRTLDNILQQIERSKNVLERQLRLQTNTVHN